MIAERFDEFGMTRFHFDSDTPIVLGKYTSYLNLSSVKGENVFSIFGKDGYNATISNPEGDDIDSYIGILYEPKRGESGSDFRLITYTRKGVGSVSLQYLDEHLDGIVMDIYDGQTLPSGTYSEETSGAMYRMFDALSGEHFYTASTIERSPLIADGWNYEGIGWYEE